MLGGASLGRAQRSIAHDRWKGQMDCGLAKLEVNKCCSGSYSSKSSQSTSYPPSALPSPFSPSPSARSFSTAASSATVGFRAEDIFDADTWHPPTVEEEPPKSLLGLDPHLVWGEEPWSQGSSSLEQQRQSLEAEARQMLDWPRLCHAVSTFASTSLGMEAVRGMLPSGSPTACQLLMRETEAVMQLEAKAGATLDFGGTDTSRVRDALRLLGKGIPLSGPQACSIAVLLLAAAGIQRTVNRAAQEERMGDRGETAAADIEGASLLHVLEDELSSVSPRPDLVKSIWRCVDEDGIVRDSASADLRRARERMQSAAARAREAVERAARGWGGGAGDVVECAGRLCIAANTQFGAGPPGLLLKVEGAIHFVEPSSSVPFNTRLLEARGEESRAEQQVLTSLSEVLKEGLEDLLGALQALVRMDIMAARARYSSWIGASRPIVQYDAETQGGGASMAGGTEGAGEGEDPSSGAPLLSLVGARHPLLLQQHRESLWRAKLRAREKGRLVARVRGRPGAVAGGMLEQAQRVAKEAAKEVEALERSLPVPIDVEISRGTRVVTITGPNTGGKTAAVKTVALAALMAKSGLYVLARPAPLLPFFDSVFCDIGDQQSLAHSLSTFSGHVQRIGRIMDCCTASSLVLLDEVGTGTDPTEGAALAAAVLEWFGGGSSGGSASRKPSNGEATAGSVSLNPSYGAATAGAASRAGGALLTLATTHHGELKLLKYRDPLRFENACVEFDELRLAPTYRLLWGIPGRSNAVNIAERLGMRASVLDAAREEIGAQALQVNDLIIRMETAKRLAEQDIAASERLTGDAERMQTAVSTAQSQLEAGEVVARMEGARQVAASASKAHSAITRTARSALAEAQLREREEEARERGREETMKGRKERSGGGKASGLSQEFLGANQQKHRSTPFLSEGGGDLTVGQTVLVTKLGKPGVIVDLKKNRGCAVVQCGIMQVTVSLDEIVPT